MFISIARLNRVGRAWGRSNKTDVSETKREISGSPCFCLGKGGKRRRKRRRRRRKGEVGEVEDALMVASTHLVDNVDAVVELMSLQERVYVVEEELQVVFALSVGDDEGDVVSRAAVGRSPQSSSVQLRVPGGERLEGLCRLCVHRDPARCTPQDKCYDKCLL